ncbi:MAG: hypothetical protein EXR53_02260 [Dehalococcoidia bacterium]|nr:hypothetical protein [Dehalococcoidia bacterium]
MDGGPGKTFIKQIVPPGKTYTVADDQPLKGLAAFAYTPDGSWPMMIPSFFQDDPGLAIPLHMLRSDTGADISTLNIPAGPTGGGYNDIEINDAAPWEMSGIGAFADKLGEFDIPSGFFTGAKTVVSGGQPLTNIVGLGMDSNGILYLANQASPLNQEGGGTMARIYSANLAGGPATPVGEFARAITNSPTHNFMLMDGTGSAGKDEIVRMEGNGKEVNRYNAPGSQHESMAILGDFLYTVNNEPSMSGNLRLYKLAPATGVVQANYPKDLPPIIDNIGDLTVTADGKKLIGVSRFTDKLYEIDPANGGVTSTKTMIAVPPAYAPWGMEGLTLVTGAPKSPFLLGVKGTSFFFIKIDTGNIYDTKPMTVFPPFNITGLTQRGSNILMTDDSQQVFRASIPGADAPESTVAGDYESSFAVTLESPGSKDTPPVVTAPFSIERVKTLEVTISDPKDGGSFTTTPITIKGLVNDPTVKKVTLGIDLPSTDLLGPASYESGLAGYTTTGMWHRTNDYGGKPARAIGNWSLAYTRDPINQGSLPPGMIFTYQTLDLNGSGDTANSGTATSGTFAVGAGTMFSAKMWYDTEPNFFFPNCAPSCPPQFDTKFIKVLTYNSAGTEVTATTTLAQIVSFPPAQNTNQPGGGGPGGYPGGYPGGNPGGGPGPMTGSTVPGTVFTMTDFAPWKLVFIPPSMIDGMGLPMLTGVELGMDAFVGKKVAIQFAYDTTDASGNLLEGWFVDAVGVTGAGSAGDQLIDVIGGAYQGVFALSEGENKIKVTAIRDVYDSMSAVKMITVSLDTSFPVLRLLLSEDLNGNAKLDKDVGFDFNGDSVSDLIVDEDIDGDKFITKLAGGVPDPVLGKLVTRTVSQTVFGVFQENNPASLSVHHNGKLVLTLKSAALTTSKFSTTIQLHNGLNTIVVSMKDEGGLEPNTAALQADAVTPLNKLSVQVILDITGPSLTSGTLAGLGTIYPFTALKGKPGDPVVYQVNASDAETGIAKVEIFLPAIKTMIAATDTPLVLRDQWSSTGNYLFPTVIPVSAPPGELKWTVKATDKAGNETTGIVLAQVSAYMTAWNTCLQRNGNLVATPIQPTNGTLATLLNQKVKNVSTAFKAGLVDQGAGGGDLSKERDAEGDATLRNVINSIQYWPGGLTGAASFQVYTPDPSADTLTTLQEGKGYWAFTKPGAFKSADPLPGFSESSFSCMNLTIPGQFLADGAVPPTFSEKAGWNTVGAHSEGPSIDPATGLQLPVTVVKFLKGLSPESQAALGSSSSLLAFKNGIEFDYGNTANLAINDRVTQKLGAFETRFENERVVLRGEGFWLFLLADGLLVP